MSKNDKYKYCGVMMLYKGYELKETENSVYVSNINNFKPVHIFKSGQCFRWEREDGNSFTGVVKGRVINIKSDASGVIFKNTNIEEFKNLWFEYFDLGTRYSLIKKKLSKDSKMKKVIEYGSGIRILKQDFREILISFIISSNNNIPRIKSIIHTISRNLGNKIEYKGKNYYTFPDLNTLANVETSEIEKCRAGYRCRYITDTSGIMVQNNIDIKILQLMDTVKARKEIMKLPGVGPKVADCVLLFSGIKYDVFPVDVWSKRAVEELYLKKETDIKYIQEFVKGYFGSLAGYAQQYLYYYARKKKIGLR